MPSSLRSQFDQSIDELTNALSVMANRVETSVRNGVEALVSHNTDLAEKVVVEETYINDMHNNIEDSCLRLLATEQPVATDLRRIVGAISVNAQLERIGDLAVHVARVAQRIAGERYIKELIDIPRMSREVCQMILESVRSFVEQNSVIAEEISSRDKVVDDIYSQVFRELLTYMMENPKNISQATSLLFVAKQLERVGDHTTNICEGVIFVTTGRHVDLNR